MKVLKLQVVLKLRDRSGAEHTSEVTGEVHGQFANLDLLKDVLGVEQFFNDKTSIRCHLHLREEERS